MADRILSIKDLTISYGNNNGASVKDFNLEVDQGQIVSIVGESGSGKTTVIRAVLGLLSGGGKIVKGDIVFRGKSLLDLNKEEWRRLRGTDISMIFQDSRAIINPIKKIGTQFVEYIRTHEKVSKDEAYKKAVDMLNKMRLPDGDNIMNSYAFQLSGGMCQRVSIAMGMTFSPKLLMADEATSALDVTTQSQIVKQIMELRKRFNTAVIMVTHNIGLAAYMGDKLIVMERGKIVDCGSREDVLKNPKSGYTENLLKAVPEIGGKRYV